ncbi:MAG: hypothetical protein Q4F57_03655 [Weeksellaceae bacterium]|nr:hypothetical protein [Weeksellaceae bacterium]
MHRKHVIYVLKMTLACLVCIFLLDRLVYAVLSRLSDNVYSGQSVGKLNYFMNNNENFDIVFLGNSRVSRHIIAKDIGAKTLNAGVDGTYIFYSTILFDLLPHDLPQTIFFHVDPSLAIDSTYAGADVMFLQAFYHKIDEVASRIDESGMRNSFNPYLKSIDYNGSFLAVITNSVISRNSFEKNAGYEPNYITPKQQKQLKRQIEKFYQTEEQCSVNVQISPLYKESLVKLKTLAAERNKRLIFFTSPRFGDRCKNDNILFRQYMDSLQLTYIDDTDYFAENNKFEYWKDYVHMADDGARLYTERINRIIDSLGIAR